jgi:transcriptional regulator with XRE-family HTH domain
VLRAGAKVLHVEPDHLVNMTDIAERSGVTKAAVSHYARGERSKGFPAPVARVTTESPLWDWVEVARWLYEQGRISAEQLLEARIVRRANISILRKREVKGRQKELV